MVRVTQVADDGTEVATIDLDDFTIEVIYAGLAEMLRQAAAAQPPVSVPLCEPSRQARHRRERVLNRLRD
jgi:hypothetical protein